VPTGQRQPLSVRGAVSVIAPAAGESGLDAWMQIGFSAPARSLRLLLTPKDVPLPFSEGEFVKVDVDCRKGGWSRVCDGVFRDASHRLLMAIAGSGDSTLVADWRVERGPLALSEARPKGPKSIRHTYGVTVRHARQIINVHPHEWQLLRASDGTWLVEGHAVRWEGARPLDALDYLHYAVVRLPTPSR
jgi:hypothetical protein